MLAEKSGVPRTKIYQVLESLQEKGWIKVYSGAPLLFKATQPEDVIKKIRQEQEEDPRTLHCIVDKMLYDECAHCFANFYTLSFNNARKI